MLVMDLALQLLFTGIGIGAVYALVALGFVLIFRATNVVNFAQGEFSMVAAYLMVVCVELGLPYWLSFLLALAGMALLGVVFNLGVYYPLRHRTYLPVIIATIGASILLANSVLAIYGPQPQVLQGWFETPGIQLGPVYPEAGQPLLSYHGISSPNSSIGSGHANCTDPCPKNCLNHRAHDSATIRNRSNQCQRGGCACCGACGDVIQLA